MHQTFDFPYEPVRRSVVWAGLAILAVLGSSAVRAQEAPEVPNTSRPNVWIEPRVSAGITLFKGDVGSGKSEQEQSLEVSPGVRALVNSARVQGYLDYSISSGYFAQDRSANNSRQELVANGTLNVWDNRAYIDVSGTIDDQSISAFAPPPRTVTDVNRSETKNFRVSPFFIGSLGRMADFELRYGLQSIKTQTDIRSDISIQDLFLRIKSSNEEQAFGWSFDATSQKLDYSLIPSTRSDSVRAGLIYSMSPQLKMTLRAGVEANDILTVARQSYNTTGLDLEWRPSTRTRLFLAVEDRYFGSSYDLAFEYRTKRTVWRFSGMRGVSNPLQSTPGSLGSIYELIDSLFSSIEPDPVRRAQLVQAELLRFGLPADSEISQSFLKSTATFDRSLELSVAIVGVRTAVTFAVSSNNSRRLGSGSSLGDDFDANSVVRQRGWSMGVAHRLTPLSSVNATFTKQRTEGEGPIRSTYRFSILTVGVTTRLAPRTSGSIQLRRDVYNNAADRGLYALLTHRF